MARLVDKERKFAQYKEDLQNAKVAVIADYRGLTVSQLSQLRGTLFPQKAKFSIVKNTIIKRALKETDTTAMEEFFQGPMAVMFGFEDEIQPTKTLKEFLQKAKIGEIKGGYMAGSKLSRQEVMDLAEMPPLEELRGKLVGAINSPLAGIVAAISSQQRGLVNVLDQYAKQKEAQG